MVCAHCSEAADEDGYCLGCGTRVQDAAHDHAEWELSQAVAGVTDRGQRHRHNEDSLALAEEGGGVVLVVCDGVSTSRRPAEASAVAANMLCTELARWLKGATPSALQQEAEDAMQQALRLADEAVRHLGYDAVEEHGAATTCVAAMVRGSTVTLGWAGDSRAYWLTADDVRQLTRDHSWKEEALRTGRVSENEAEQSPLRHAITRWLGPGREAGNAFEVTTWPWKGTGFLLLCTDGFWNHADTAEQMKERFASAWETADKSALRITKKLVQFANEAGGEDNITVAVCSLGSENQGSEPFTGA